MIISLKSEKSKLESSLQSRLESSLESSSKSSLEPASPTSVGETDDLQLLEKKLVALSDRTTETIRNLSYEKIIERVGVKEVLEKLNGLADRQQEVFNFNSIYQRPVIQCSIQIKGIVIDSIDYLPVDCLSVPTRRQG